VRGPKCASRKKIPNCRRCDFFDSAQSRVLSGENARHYDESASGELYLDTPRVITDTAGNKVWEWQNTDPFGNNVPNENPNGAGTFTFNLRYPGQYFDKETGLHQNYFRDYDPANGGRYIESDPRGILLDFSDPERRAAAQIGIAIPDKKKSGYLNHNYVYANNNPEMYADPTGEDFGLTIAIIWAIAYFNHAGDSISQPNGNMWGEPKRQDNVCSLGPVLGPVADACVLDRCQRHDNCYAANQCTASSWASSALGGTKSCNQCNGGFFK
jgi:RHS repeat-associated protein